VYLQRSKPIEIRRSDIERLLAYPKPPRDQLIHCLAANMGLRTGEVATVRIEYIDLEKGTLFVLDSKRHELSPVPIDYETAELMEKVSGKRERGLLIQRRFCYQGKTLEDPLTDTNLWYLVRRYACKAGIPNWEQYNLRLLRHYFASTFAFPKDPKEHPGSQQALRIILRHKDLTYTQVYQRRLVPYEYVQREFNRLRKPPQIRRNENVNMLVNDDLNFPQFSKFYEENCRTCASRLVCKYMPEAMSNEYAETCRFKPKEVQRQP